MKPGLYRRQRGRRYDELLEQKSRVVKSDSKNKNKYALCFIARGR